MSFASEIASSRTKAAPSATATPTLPTQAVPVAETSPAPASDAVLNDGMLPMPEHGSVHPEQAAGLSPSQMNGSEVTPELKQDAPKSGKIRIGTEVFDSPEEAIQYATDLQLALAQKDAVDQYKTASQPAPATELEVDPYAEFGSKLFEDPEATLKKVTELAEQRAEKRMNDRLAEAQRQEQMRQAEDNSWKTFFSENADLSQSKDLVEYVMHKNWEELSKLSPQKAPAALAEKTRALLGSQRESMLPSKELQNRAAIVPGASSVAGAPIETKKATSIDFISQLKKHGKRT